MGGLKFIEKHIPKSLEAAKERKVYPVSRIMSMQGGHIQVVKALGTPIYEEENVWLNRLELEDYDYFYYPLKGKTVINTILNCLSDPSVYVNRFALDYIITHMPIASGLNNDQMNITLVEAVLQLVTKKDFACLKKFSTWLLSHLDEEDEDSVDY